MGTTTWGVHRQDMAVGGAGGVEASGVAAGLGGLATQFHSRVARGSCDSSACHWAVAARLSTGGSETPRTGGRGWATQHGVADMGDLPWYGESGYNPA
jgi:hypothetical protein